MSASSAPISAEPPPIDVQRQLDGADGILRVYTLEELRLDSVHQRVMAEEGYGPVAARRLLLLDLERFRCATSWFGRCFRTRAQAQLDQSARVMDAEVPPVPVGTTTCSPSGAAAASSSEGAAAAEDEDAPAKPRPAATAANEALRKAYGDPAAIRELLIAGVDPFDAAEDVAANLAGTYVSVITISFAAQCLTFFRRAQAKSAPAPKSTAAIALCRDAYTFTPARPPYHGRRIQATPAPFVGVMTNAPEGYETLPEANMKLATILLALCDEYDLLVSLGVCGVRRLYQQLDTIGALISNWIEVGIREFWKAYDDAFFHGLMTLDLELTAQRAELNVLLRNELGLPPPLPPGNCIQWKDQLWAGLPLLEPVVNLTPNEEALVWRLTHYRADVPAKKPLKVLADMAAGDPDGKSSDPELGQSARKALEESFTAVTGCQNGILGDPRLVISGKVIEGGPDVEYYDEAGLPWDQKRIVGAGEGGRLSKTQEKSARIVRKGVLTDVPVLVGLLFDATYASDAEYQSTWSKIYARLAMGQVWLNRPIPVGRDVQMRPAIAEVVCPFIVTAPPRRQLVRNRLGTKGHPCGSFGAEVVLQRLSANNTVAFASLPGELQHRINEIRRGEKDKIRDVHIDRQQALSVGGQFHIALEYNALTSQIIKAAYQHAEVQEEISDLWRLIWLPKIDQVFFTFTHYERWVELPATLRPPFFEIDGLPPL